MIVYIFKKKFGICCYYVLVKMKKVDIYSHFWQLAGALVARASVEECIKVTLNVGRDRAWTADHAYFLVLKLNVLVSPMLYRLSYSKCAKIGGYSAHL